MDPTLPERLRAAIRDVPDFPKPGILFRDITTVLLRPDLMQESIDALWEEFGNDVDIIAGIESRGFLLGATLAVQKQLPFVPFRKPGKLPAETYRESYALEYGTDALEVHKDAIGKEQRVLILDDLLATGGTAAAAIRLVEQCGGSVAGIGFMIELIDLGGRAKLGDAKSRALLQYEGD